MRRTVCNVQSGQEIVKLLHVKDGPAAVTHYIKHAWIVSPNLKIYGLGPLQGFPRAQYHKLIQKILPYQFITNLDVCGCTLYQLCIVLAIATIYPSELPHPCTQRFMERKRHPPLPRPRVLTEMV